MQDDSRNSASAPAKRAAATMPRVPRKALLGGAAALALLLCLLAGNWFYTQNLLSDAQDAARQKDHAAAAAHYANYHAANEDDFVAAMALARQYLHLQQYDMAASILQKYDAAALDRADAARLHTFGALVALLRRQPDDALARLNAALRVDNFYIPAAFLEIGLYFFNENNMTGAQLAATEAQRKLATLDAASAAQAVPDIVFMRDVLFAANPDILAATWPLPFDVLPDSKALGASDAAGVLVNLRLSADSFLHQYAVPTARASPADQDLSVADNIALMRAAAAIRQNDDAAAQTHLQSLQSEASQWGDYLSAYVAARARQFDAAAEHYRAIGRRAAAPLADAMLATALWAAGGGGAPTAEMRDLYQSALAKQPDNIAARANLAFFHLYENNLSEARRLLQDAPAAARDNFYIAYNMALINLADNDFAAAEEQLRRLLAAQPDALPAALALAHTHLMQANQEQAAAALLQLRGFGDSPAHYLAAARLFEAHALPRRAIGELARGRRKFPQNTDLAGELLLQHALLGNQRQYNETRATLPESVLSEQPRALMAAAWVQRDIAQAQTLFGQAFEKAATPAVQQTALAHWMRYLLAGGLPQEARRVAELARGTFSGALPRMLQPLQIWADAAIAAQAAPQQDLLPRLQDTLQYALPAAAQIDAGYAMLAAGDSEQAAEFLRSRQIAQGPPRLLIALRQALDNLGLEEEVAAMDAQLQQLGQQSADAAQAGPVAGAAEGSSLAAIAVGEGDSIEALNNAVRANDYNTAIVLYDDLINDPDPRFTRSVMHQNRGVLHMRIQQYEQAAADFRQALQLGELSDKNEEATRYNLGIALAQNGQYADSAAALQTLLDKQPNNLNGWLLYAQVTNQQGDKDRHARLIDIYSKIIALRPTRAQTYLDLAKARQNVFDMPAAIKALQQGITALPRDKALHARLAEYYSVIGDKQNAEKHLAIADSL